MITTLPNLLTLSRIVVIPLIVAALWLRSPEGNWLAFLLFAAACITDFLDGYMARRRRQLSAFGRFLDPIADKLLVAAVLLMLVGMHTISGATLLPALIILCREIMVSGLREYLAELRVGLPVSKLAKWKTTIQMVALGVLVVGDAGPSFLPVLAIGEIGLWLAAALTLVTGYDYLRAGLAHMADDEAKPPPPPPGAARSAGGRPVP